jgi:hypothetical protein
MEPSLTVGLVPRIITRLPAKHQRSRPDQVRSFDRNRYFRQTGTITSNRFGSFLRSESMARAHFKSGSTFTHALPYYRQHGRGNQR